MRDDIKRLAERVAEMDIVCNMTHLAARDLCETRDAIAAELRALAHKAGNLVPGVMHCAKCKLRLHRTTLYMGSGTTGAGDSKTEPCPNGCGPLWPVTWEQEAREAMALVNGLHEQLQAAQQQGKPDHVEDKLGMVPEGWRNRIVAIERNSEYDTDLRTDTPILILRFASVSLRESANPLAKGWVDRGLVAAALAQPADADAEGAR